MQFYDIIRILNAADVVTVYYKFLLAVKGAAQLFFDASLEFHVLLMESSEEGKYIYITWTNAGC